MSEVTLNVTKDGKLVRKLAEVAAKAKRIPKEGHNDFHNYDYATESDITDLIRPLLAEKHIMIFPSVLSRELREVPGKGATNIVTVLTVEFAFVDGETGESIKVTAVGEGQDNGDKGCYKAMTGATKYALLKTFLLATGDDPEDEEEHKLAPRPAPAPQPRPQPAPAPAPSKPLPTAGKGFPVSDAQKKRLFALAHKAGVEAESLKAWIRSTWNCEIDDLRSYKDTDGTWKGSYQEVCAMLDGDPEVLKAALRDAEALNDIDFEDSQEGQR